MRIREAKVRRNMGYVIRENRLRKKMFQEGLSRGAGITMTFLGLIENGKRVPSIAQWYLK